MEYCSVIKFTVYHLQLQYSVFAAQSKSLEGFTQCMSFHYSYSFSQISAAAQFYNFKCYKISANNLLHNSMDWTFTIL